MEVRKLSRQQELSTEQYLARSHIATYFQDAIERMLECKAQGERNGFGSQHWTYIQRLVS